MWIWGFSSVAEGLKLDSVLSFEKQRNKTEADRVSHLAPVMCYYGLCRTWVFAGRNEAFSSQMWISLWLTRYLKMQHFGSDCPWSISVCCWFSLESLLLWTDRSVNSRHKYRVDDIGYHRNWSSQGKGELGSEGVGKRVTSEYTHLCMYLCMHLQFFPEASILIPFIYGSWLSFWDAFMGAWVRLMVENVLPLLIYYWAVLQVQLRGTAGERDREKLCGVLLPLHIFYAFCPVQVNYMFPLSPCVLSPMH